MSTQNPHQLLVNHLNENLNNLEKSVEILNYSYRKCEKVSDKNDYKQSDFDNFELLTSRFARTSDILIQKVFKTLFLVLGNDVGTLIDLANQLEKFEIVKKADDILNIRTLRNQIAHEYSTEDLNKIFHSTLIFTPILLEIIQKTQKYISERVLSR